jgi:hypothetical protein
MLLMRSLKNISAEKAAMLLFTSIPFLFFSIFYYQHIFQREQTQLFELGIGYFLKSLSYNGGFAIYTGEFLTQFFRIPVLGAFIITALLILLQQAFKRLIYAVWQSGHFSVISWIPSLLYCILLTRQFYYISGLIGLIIAVVASLWYIKTNRVKIRILKGLILLPVVYWLTGGAYLVFTLNIVFAELALFLKDHKVRQLKSITLTNLFCLFLATAVPPLARKFLFTDTLLQSYLSEAYYAVRIFFPVPLILVFASVSVLMVIYGFLPTGLSDKQLFTINTATVYLLAALTILGLDSFSDFGEEKEMAYENLIYVENWGKIIEKAEAEQPSGQVPMAAINLALARTGRLSSEMFHFSQDENSLFIPYIRRGLTPFTTGEPYYYLGLYNFSQMFAMETIESTVDAKVPSRSVRRVAETYFLNGQFDIAGKYFTILSHTLFYGKQAKKYLDILNSDKSISVDPLTSEKKKLMPEHDFYYDYQNMDFALKNLIVSNPQNRMAFEYLMAYYLLKKDLDGFLQSIALVNQMGYNDIPVVYQEAIAYILTRLPDAPRELQSMVTDQAVIDNLQAYANLYSVNRLDTMKLKNKFGNTYWYYLHYK